jgi:pilus assembly protein CpaE
LFRDGERSYGGPVIRERGQASVELVALLPALVLLALAGWQAVLIGWSVLEAEHAARVAARAAMIGGSPGAAARSALPGALARGSAVSVSGGRLRVRLKVPSVIPGLSPYVTSSAPVVRQ